MAEGGQPPIVYHIENLENLNVAAGQNVTNIKKSSVGSIAIRSNSGEQRDEALPQNDENGGTESGEVFVSEHKHNGPEMNEADITWLQNGRFGLFIKEPLHTEETVYRGVQKLMSIRNRDVAIKRLVYQERKRKEVDLLLRLQHPNIVQIIDAFDQRDAFHWIYIVMELCSQNLQNYIDENKLKSPDFGRLFSFSKQLVDGLAYLHQSKVIHRDLKPENVLISMCKKFIKLSDFGMSKELQKHRSIATVTTIGAGSEGYKPPETYQPGTHISPRLDIFPLGLILHLLFTNGLHAFGPDSLEWRDNIRKNKNLDLSQIPEFEKPNDSKKRQLLELLTRMLRHLPLDRPTADEVKNDSFFKDLMQEGENTIYDDVEALDISSPSTITPVPESSKDFKYSSQNEGKTMDEQVATTKVTLPSTSSPASQDTKPTKQEENSVNNDVKPVSFSTARSFWKQMEHSTRARAKSTETTEKFSQEEGNTIDDQVAALDISSSRTSSEVREALKDSKFAKHEEIHVSDIVESTSISVANEGLDRKEDATTFLSKSSDTKAVPMYENHVLNIGSSREIPSTSIYVGVMSEDKKNDERSKNKEEKGILAATDIGTSQDCRSIIESPPPPPLPSRDYIPSSPPPPLPSRSIIQPTSHPTPIRENRPRPPRPPSQRSSARDTSPPPPPPRYQSRGVPPPPRPGAPPPMNAPMMGSPPSPDSHPPRYLSFKSSKGRRAPAQRYEKEALPGQIRQGMELKPVSEDETNDKPSFAVEDDGGLEGEQARVLHQREKAIHERASKLMEMGEFQNAGKVLHELYNYGGSDKLQVALKIAECELHLQRGGEQESIRRLREIVSTSTGFSVGEVREMAGKLLEGKNYVRSLILLHISHDLHKNKVVSSNKVQWISSVVHEVSVYSRPLLQAGGVPRDIGLSYGLKFMESLLNELRSVNNVDPEVRAVNEADCLVSITYICRFAGEYRRLIDFGINGVKIMENQFGVDASKYKQYGKLLNNVAFGYANSDDNFLAEKYFDDAMKAYETAVDYTEDDRKEWVDRTTKNLDIIRRQIKNSEEN